MAVIEPTGVAAASAGAGAAPGARRGAGNGVIVAYVVAYLALYIALITPVISTRNVESDVLLQSGRTVLLAGLIQDRLEQREGGVPVLRTVPVVGELFKTKSDNVRRVELIVMITPRVARTTSQVENVTRLLQSQIHSR